MPHAKACEKAAEDPDKEHVARARHMQASSSYWKKYAWHHPNYMKLQPLVRTSSRQRQEISRHPEPCFNWFQQASKTRQDTHFSLLIRLWHIANHAPSASTAYYCIPPSGLLIGLSGLEGTECALLLVKAMHVCNFW